MTSGGQPSADVPAVGRLQTLDAAAPAASEEPDPDAVGAPEDDPAPTAKGVAPPAEAPPVRGRPQGFNPAAFAALAAFGDTDPAEDAEEIGGEPGVGKAPDGTAPPTTSA